MLSIRGEVGTQLLSMLKRYLEQVCYHEIKTMLIYFTENAKILLLVNIQRDEWIVGQTIGKKIKNRRMVGNSLSKVHREWIIHGLNGLIHLTSNRFHINKARTHVK